MKKIARKKSYEMRRIQSLDSDILHFEISTKKYLNIGEQDIEKNSKLLYKILREEVCKFCWTGTKRGLHYANYRDLSRYDLLRHDEVARILRQRMSFLFQMRRSRRCYTTPFYLTE